MATRFINSKTAYLYEGAQGGTRHMVLIFGDEVQTTGPEVNGRTPVTARRRAGFVRTSQLQTQGVLECYFIDVGQGDATFVVTPGRKKILIDGGVNRRALGFLTWMYRLHKGTSAPVDIDLLVLTHADGDHLDGLTPIVEHPKINVKKVVHPGIATFASGAFDTRLGETITRQGERYLVTKHGALSGLPASKLTDSFAAWRTAISNENADYERVDSGTGAIDVGDDAVVMQVLGPRLVPHPDGVNTTVYPWMRGEAYTINGHSVVLKLTHGEVTFLFPGDLNVEGSRHLLADTPIANSLGAHVLKAPHHGSHEYEPDFLEAVRPQITVISSGDDPDHGHPRAVYIGATGHHSRSSQPLVFSTEIAASFVDSAVRVAGDGDDTMPQGVDLNDVDLTQPQAPTEIRHLFKRRLHGMINVRTDGLDLYAARRVTASYWWEAYGPIKPVPHWAV